MTADELFVEYQFKTKSELEIIAAEAFHNIVGLVSNKEDFEFAFKFGMVIVANAINVDNNVDNEDMAKFILKIINNNESTIEEVGIFAKIFLGSKFVDGAIEFINQNNEIKDDVLKLVMAISSYDGEISLSEFEFINYLVEE